MWSFLGAISILAFFVFIILAIVWVFRKKAAKKLFLIAGGCFALFIVAIAATPAEDNKQEAKSSPAPIVSPSPTKAPEPTKVPAVDPTVVPTEKPTPEPTKESVPREYKAALKKAEQYAENMHMSKAGVYDQLTSEYGENFPKEAAQYAIDNIVFDWKENALKKARSYAETMSMSDSAIHDQLISEYGEKFTEEEAKYAIDNL